MANHSHILDNATEVLDSARDALARLCTDGVIPVLLVPTRAAVLRFEKAFSDCSCALGVRIETFNSWIADRWELFGDGRRIVTPAEQALLLRQACNAHEAQAQDEPSFEPTTGVIDLLAQVASEALPFVVSVDGPQAASAGLSVGEREVIRVLKNYEALLDAMSLCEISQAAVLLPQLLSDATAQPPVVLAGFDELGPMQQRLVAALAETREVLRLDDGCRAASATSGRAEELESLLNHLGEREGKYPDPVIPTGAVRFLLPSGRYAAPRLIAEEIVHLVNLERERSREAGIDPLPVLVTARDSHALFEEVADDLLLQGITATATSRQEFANTMFGRAFLSLLAFEFDDSWCVEQVSDFALSPFSGIDKRSACELDAAWRGDRTIVRSQMQHDMEQVSSTARILFDALEHGTIENVLNDFELVVHRLTDFDEALCSEQLRAIAAARSFSQTCERLGTTLCDERELLAHIPVVSTARTTIENARGQAADSSLNNTSSYGSAPLQPNVVFLSQEQAADYAESSCAALMLCDLTASDYPVRPVEDSATLLLEKLGLSQPRDVLMQARRRMFRALAAARDTVVCERVLNMADASKAYPAIMLEELLDCYRPLSSEANESDDDTGLPASLVPFARTAGEEELCANLSLGDKATQVQRQEQQRAQQQEQQQGQHAEEPSGQFWDLPQTGDLSPRLKPYIVPGSSDGLTLSPSAIESYLECPYKWFVRRRLNLSVPDAECGPLEMGTFAHGVFESFYKHFQEAGRCSVNADNLPEARDLMQEIFERHLKDQLNKKPTRSRLIPCSNLEEAEVDDLERELVNYLDIEAALLPTFVPTYFEFKFGSDEPFEYAGFHLHGTIDRIDVNDQGQAVIIDYKGSLSDAYALASATPSPQADGAPLPLKVQALMYAQVARRLLGLDVVGALYVSYGKHKQICGAFDRTVLGEEVLPGIKADSCGVPGVAAELFGVDTFKHVVDAVEDGIAVAAQSLAAGQIEPNPHGNDKNDDACKYCPVSICERRRRA